MPSMILVHKPSAQKVGKTLLARMCSGLQELSRTFPGRGVPCKGDWSVSWPGKELFLQNRQKFHRTVVCSSMGYLVGMIRRVALSPARNSQEKSGV